jgi:hypothetical protein
MRRSIAHIIALACWLPVVAPAGAQMTDATRLLDEGNQHFREGDFDQARFSYEGALDLGLESGAAYYNLGNAYFRLDRLGKAMLNYQRAARFFPEDEALAHNMDLVRARARDQLSVLPQPVWAKWWNGFVDRVGLTPLFWIGAACWLGGLGLLGWRIQHGSASSNVRRLSSVLIVVGLVASASAVATSVARSDDVPAVVTASQAAVLETPSNESRIELVVHEALVVDVLGELGRWTHVRLPNGVTGYVETETIEAI